LAYNVQLVKLWPQGQLLMRLTGGPHDTLSRPCHVITF